MEKKTLRFVIRSIVEALTDHPEALVTITVCILMFGIVNAPLPEADPAKPLGMITVSTIYVCYLIRSSIND